MKGKSYYERGGKFIASYSSAEIILNSDDDFNEAFKIAKAELAAFRNRIRTADNQLTGDAKTIFDYLVNEVAMLRAGINVEAGGQMVLV